MTPYDQIFENNRRWAEEQLRADPEYFHRLSREQRPDFLYIGCSDSRVPANQIMGLAPGDVFVHRNVGNLVNNVDLNVMSVIFYGVRHLDVKHIIVCGHYGCGGVQAAMQPKDLGILNPWLRNIRDVYRMYKAELNAITDEAKRYDRLVELNVIEQSINIIKTAAVQKSYLKRGYPIVHSWVFDMNTGTLKDLKLDFKKTLETIQEVYDLTGESNQQEWPPDPLPRSK
ncbi:carbonic anhydrase [Pyxidicoccus xibeiensis]|uniref:carbonic anhydrase n=1 Tax=Pyxidicoccus xibeiensis TaxID=2906759 RepID=UPI0020A6F76B|nr:carbonic anhydrase [Pyxidicoccus xibeiensis]MCP3143479.1 carbonic anhydrase [Pyxidicoccus xibeiensis]